KVNIIMENFAAIITAILLICTLLENRIYKKKFSVFPGIIITTFLMLICDSANFQLLDYSYTHHMPRMMASRIMESVSYGFYFTMLVFFTIYVFETIKINAPVSIIYVVLSIAINFVRCVLWMLSPFTRLVLYYDAAYNYIGGSLLYFTQTLGYLNVLIMVLMIMRNIKILGWRYCLALLAFILFPFIASVERYFTQTSCSVQISFSVSLVLMYFFIQRDKDRKLAEQDLQLKKERMTILFSQIRPHFMYNVLNSIYVLCETDVHKAQYAVNEFSHYLRTNLISISENELIPFNNELDHVRHYLNLEKIRFGEKLIIEYSLEDTSFEIPPLTVQPIVENSIKHGITKKRGGGIISIKTLLINNRHRIIINDNGVGFDPKKVTYNEKDHVGITNVKERLGFLCRGTMDIVSVPDMGTTVTIEIPKTERKKVSVNEDRSNR
ncbi:MAG: histidine kinase, partial [Lachnospiraceae bacterium]|nr:histidine kinase [Lachnospiraceae bacterium]